MKSMEIFFVVHHATVKAASVYWYVRVCSNFSIMGIDSARSEDSACPRECGKTNTAWIDAEILLRLVVRNASILPPGEHGQGRLTACLNSDRATAAFTKGDAKDPASMPIFLLEEDATYRTSCFLQTTKVLPLAIWDTCFFIEVLLDERAIDVEKQPRQSLLEEGVYSKDF
jgi:hypothetical protein